MCLTLNTVESRKLKITTEDIICYKVLIVTREKNPKRLDYSSPYRGYPYKLGEMVVSPLMKEVSQFGTQTVEKGLHSFVTLEHAKTELYDGDAFVFVAIIPQGTEYYHGGFNVTDDSYASDRLLVLDREDPRSLAVLANIPTIVR